LDARASICVSQFTTTINLTADYDVGIEPSAATGLRAFSQVMADKRLTVARHRVGSVIGHLDDTDLRRLDTALALALGLQD
jgi:mRNA interferase MazF